MTWPIKKIEEICDFISPGVKRFSGTKKYVATADIDGDEIVNSIDISYDDRPDRANVEVLEKDILVARMAQTEKFLLTDNKHKDNYIFSTGFAVLRVHKDINSSYLFYFLTSKDFNLQKDKLATGATQKAINNGAFKKIKISFPPLKIQKQIVERLDKIAEAQKLNDELIQKTDELFQSLLRKELNSDGKDWDVKKLEEIAEIESGGTPDTKKIIYWNGDILWLTPKELSGFTNIEIFNTERKITKEGLKGSSAKLLPRGTVLMSSRAPIGYLTIASKEITTNQGFKNFICDKKLIDNFYLYYFLTKNKKKIQNLGHGATFAEVNKTMLEKIEIPLPSLKIQKQIVATLSAVQDYKKQLLEQKSKLKELFDSVLNKSMK